MLLDAAPFSDVLGTFSETLQIRSNDPDQPVIEVLLRADVVDSDSPLPELSISDVTIAEGDSGLTNAVFIVTLSDVSSEVVTVNYSTSSKDTVVCQATECNRIAIPGEDYWPIARTLTFDPGQTNKTITVLIMSDTKAEPDELFVVILSQAQGATIADDRALATILDDDDDSDALEPNNTATAATNLGEVKDLTISNLSTSQADPDWFLLTAGQTGLLTVQALTAADGASVNVHMRR